MQLRFAQQMKKGALDMLVLKLLQHEEKYGYQLISELRDRSNGALALKEGTLYPILYRLEDGGLVTSRMSAHVAKEPRASTTRSPRRGATRCARCTRSGTNSTEHVRSIMEEEQ